MKSIKVFLGDKRLRNIYPHATRFQVFKYKVMKGVKRLVLASFLIGTIVGAYKVGNLTSMPHIVMADREVIKEVEIKAPVLERIAKCESGNQHYKNGQVILRANTNGSVDIGKYQINSIWAKKATEMKLDLSKESDNEAFAKWLYVNKGTEPWYASKSCWSK